MNKYELKDGYLTGPNLRFESSALVEPERQRLVHDGKLIILDAIVDLLNGAYLSGRSSVLINYDERAALDDAIALMQSLKTIGGGLSYDRFDRIVRAINKVLGQQEPTP